MDNGHADKPRSYEERREDAIEIYKQVVRILRTAADAVEEEIEKYHVENEDHIVCCATKTDVTIDTLKEARSVVIGLIGDEIGTEVTRRVAEFHVDRAFSEGGFKGISQMLDRLGLTPEDVLAMGGISIDVEGSGIETPVEGRCKVCSQDIKEKESDVVVNKLDSEGKPGPARMYHEKCFSQEVQDEMRREGGSSFVVQHRMGEDQPDA